MRRGLTIATFLQVALLIWVTAVAPVFAEVVWTAGASPATGGGGDGTIRGEAAALAPASFREITAAFTGTPTTGTIGDITSASRATFSATEAIQFNAILLESGLAGTTAFLTVFVFDPRGLFVENSPVITQTAPTNPAGFFIRRNSGSGLVGVTKWFMVITDAVGNPFVTPFQTLVVQ